MAKARAVVQVGDHRFEMQSFELPKIGAEDALLKIEACGICGSDVDQYDGKLNGILRLPMIPGHEPLGIIEEIGAEASRRWGVAAGDRVAVEPLLGCGHCRNCMTGNYRLCRVGPFGTGVGMHGFFSTHTVPARCAPVVGSDSTNEDAKSGFNGLLSEMYVNLVAHKMTLMMNSVQPAYPAQISFLDPNTFHLWGADTGVMWPPAPSKWDLAETWVVDAKRVRDKLAGYCYGNRRMYIDAQDYHISGEDINDMSGKLWKLIMLFARLHPNGYGDMYESGTGNWSFATIDLQNEHQSVTSEFYSNLANTDVEPDLWSISRYASPTGLLEIMK